MNIFTIKMFVFANYVQKINFEGTQLRMLGVSLTQSYLFVMSLLRVLRECCFRAPKILLDKYFTIKRFILLILYKKSILSHHCFRRWAQHSLNFIYLCCLHCGYQGNFALKLLKFCWRYIFIIEMFITANFIQKIEQAQCKKMGVAFSKFIYLYCVWYQEKVVLKLQKFCLTNIFTTETFISADFNQKLTLMITVLDDGCGTFSVFLNLFSLLRVLGQKISFDEIFGRT